MDCKGCSIAKICKAYEAVKEYSEFAKITITECEMKPGTKELEPLAQPTATPRQKEVWPEERPIRDFTAVSNQNKIQQEAEKKSKTKLPFQVIAVEHKAEKITCPTCEGETLDDDLSVCSECGKTICSNCGTEKQVPDPQNPKDYIGVNVCEACWNK